MTTRQSFAVCGRLISLVLLSALGVWLNSASGHAASPTVGDSQRFWPQWRGPLASGASTTAHPPLEWGEDKNVKWKVAVPGSGTSSPIVWGDQIFIQTAIPTGKKIEAAESPPPDEKAAPNAGGRGLPNIEKPTEVYQFVLLCLDRATGQELWRQIAREEVPHEGHHPDHGYASFSPVTDGTCVIAYFGSRGLHCYDMDGHPRWSKDLGKMKTNFSFGEGSSPALVDNTVIINWDHEGDDFIAAFDKQTGDELWRTPRDEKTGWATPLVVSVDGKYQVIVAATSKTRAYNLTDGHLIWECAGLKPNSIPSPVTADGLVYVTTGFQGSAMLAIRLGQSGDLTGTDAVAWKIDKDTPYVPSPLLYDGRLYFFKVNDGIVSCVDAKTGETVFGPQRVEGLKGAYASPVAADGRVYLVGRNGTTVVIKAGSAFEVLATNVLDDPIDASPALVGNELFLRGKEHLYCIARK
jgi:outer membrane protein assembly factor BamB